MALKITDLKCIKCGSEEDLINHPISKVYQSKQESFMGVVKTTTTTTWTASSKVPVCRDCSRRDSDLDSKNLKIILINSIFTIGIFVFVIILNFIGTFGTDLLNPLRLSLIGLILLGILVYPINASRHKKHKDNINSRTMFGFRAGKRVLMIKSPDSSDWVYFDDWAKSILNERYGLLDVIDKTKTGIEESKMKFCTDCGEKLNPDSDFCGNCGYKLTR
ncbi:MAG: zinc ribbon domain-containing protein [Candidatus Lokiarchaeota archaeon]|nr:zinc ribbon domain-containing protein [Candidatus Lokiarchaeota archaeon]